MIVVDICLILVQQVMYLWIGRNCNPNFLTQVLGVPNYAAVPDNLVWNLLQESQLFNTVSTCCFLTHPLHPITWICVPCFSNKLSEGWHNSHVQSNHTFCPPWWWKCDPRSLLSQYLLPELDTAESQRTRAFIGWLRDQRPFFPSLQVIRWANNILLKRVKNQVAREHRKQLI